MVDVCGGHTYRTECVIYNSKFDKNGNIITIWYGSFIDFNIDKIKCWKYLKY